MISYSKSMENGFAFFESFYDNKVINNGDIV